jgi:IPT/TIG domain
MGVNRLRWAAFALIAAGINLVGCSGGNNPPFNATPAIGNLFPSNIVAGSPGFTMSVNGTGFVSSSKGASFLYWNGSPRSTSLNQITGQLQVQILASDVANPGTVNVTIVNPAPGGGESTPVPFTVETPQAGAPALAMMSAPFSPTSATAGGQAFTLTVNGSNFTANDTVTWNGSVRTTTFVNPNQVTAAILQNDIADAGTASVAVFTPGLVVGSLSEPFPVTGPNNPNPSIGSLSPSTVSVGSGDTEVMISGSGFNLFSNAEWSVNNGPTTPLATAFLSGSQVIVMIPAAELAASTTAMIEVVNPAPGGGTSKQLTFTVK